MYWVVHVETWASVEECQGSPSTECVGMRAYFKKKDAEDAAERINAARREYQRLVDENYTPVHLKKAA